jgi:hypothetical protein
MNFTTVPGTDVLVWLSAALAHAASWRSVILVLAALVIWSFAGLLAEWQRRKTLVALLKHARGGTVIVQDRGRGGPAIRIEVGSESKDQITSYGGR